MRQRKKQKEEKEKTEKAEKEKEAKDKEKTERDKEFKADVAKIVDEQIVKSLKTIAREKMMKTKIQVRDGSEKDGRTCLDSGADRIVRSMNRQGETEEMDKTSVELANGQIVEMFRNLRGTLVSQQNIQTIVPLVPVLQHLGFKLRKRGEEMTLERENRVIQLFRDQGVLECSQEDGQELMAEIEQLRERSAKQIERKKEGEEEETELTKVLRELAENEDGQAVLARLEEYFQTREGEEEQQAGQHGEKEAEQRPTEEEEQRLQLERNSEKCIDNKDESEKNKRKKGKKREKEMTADIELNWYEMSGDEEEQALRERTKAEEKAVEADKEEQGETRNREVTKEGVQEGTNKRDQANDRGMSKIYPCKSDREHEPGGSGGEFEKGEAVRENQKKERDKKAKPERVELKLREEQDKEKKPQGKEAEERENQRKTRKTKDHENDEPTREDRTKGAASVGEKKKQAEKDQEEQKANSSEKEKTKFFVATVAKRALAATTGATRSNRASASRVHEQKVSEKTKQMREICCEERRGMRGCCDRTGAGFAPGKRLRKQPENLREVQTAATKQSLRLKWHARDKRRNRSETAAKSHEQEILRQFESC